MDSWSGRRATDASESEGVWGTGRESLAHLLAAAGSTASDDSATVRKFAKAHKMPSEDDLHSLNSGSLADFLVALNRVRGEEHANRQRAVERKAARLALRQAAAAGLDTETLAAVRAVANGRATLWELRRASQRAWSLVRVAMARAAELIDRPTGLPPAYPWPCIVAWQRVVSELVKRAPTLREPELFRYCALISAGEMDDPDESIRKVARIVVKLGQAGVLPKLMALPAMKALTRVGWVKQASDERPARPVAPLGLPSRPPPSSALPPLAPASRSASDPVPVAWLRRQVPQSKVKGDSSKLAEWLKRRHVKLFKIARRNHAERTELLSVFSRRSRVHRLITEYDPDSD